MCGPYWSQWDSGDLDSWLGKDYPGHDDPEDIDVEETDGDSCSCGYYCMDCLGMSWSDFM